MHPIRRLRLFKLIGFVTLAGVIISLVLYALRQNIDLYFTPSQVASGLAPKHHSFRMGGYVMPHSIIFSKHQMQVNFKLTDFHHQIQINYQGILPDLFREGQGVIVEGQLIDPSHFQANQVLAKHDEKYQPPVLKGMQR